MIFYSPMVNKFFQMIGSFDATTINTHEEKFKNGKLAVIDAKVAKKDIKFETIDCPA